MSKNLQQVRSASPWGAHRLARFGWLAGLLLMATLCRGGEEGGLHATAVDNTTNRVVFKPCGRWPERMRGPVYALQMVGNHVYAAVMGSGLVVYEITSDGGLRQEGCWPMLGAVYAVAVQGHFAYVGLEDEVAVIDVTDPKAIKEVARIPSERDLQTLAASGTLAFLPAKLGEKDGVALVDVSDPTRPRRVGEFTTDAEVQCIAAKDGHALVACGKGGLGIWDCREPAKPRQTGGFKTQGPAISVFVLGNLAYLLDGAERFVVLDLSDASNPALLGSIIPKGAAYWHWDRLWAAGNYVYLAGQADLDVVDVREPRHPKVVRTLWQANSQAIAGANGWLIAWGELGLTAYDLARPEKPVRRGSLPKWSSPEMR